ncbi:Pol Polyprotein [Phytophthora megakarya]|uniref:Pol Polyprotein n=1 Tax=Phytophthora megakarya TaxID=4795 RepID=A0A225VIT0_9STRA|nr:Pol Polyprotein [Phytophthora megakarya]
MVPSSTRARPGRRRIRRRAEMVMIRPEGQRAVGSKKAPNARSQSEILKDRWDPFHSLLAEYGDVVSKTPPIGNLWIEGSVTRLTWFQEHNTQSNVIDAFFRVKNEAGLQVSALHADILCPKTKCQMAYKCSYDPSSDADPSQALGNVKFKDSDVELSARSGARIYRNFLDGVLLYYSTGSEDAPLVVVPHDEELKYRILYEAHDSSVAGRLGLDSVSRHYWWPKLYKWVKIVFGELVCPFRKDVRGRRNVWNFEVGDRVLLNAKNLLTHAVFAVFKTKMRPRFIEQFTVVAKKGLAYMLNLPKKMRTHPVFYVALLKPNHGSSQIRSEELALALRLVLTPTLEYTNTKYKCD